MRFFNFVSSMNAGLLLLALIAIASAVGSSLWPEIFFKTLYFRLLLLLFFINMALCTCNSLSRFIARKNKFWHNKRQMFRSICLILLHSGIVLIIIGAGINSYWGHSVQLSIQQGEAVEINQIVPLKTPFQLKLLDFKTTFNEDGSPAQYYSTLQISPANQNEQQYTISVNHPLTFAGVKFYQHSFGYLLSAEKEDAGSSKHLLLDNGDTVSFASTHRSVRIFKYIPDFDSALGMQTRSMEPKNQRIIYSVYDGNNLLGVGTASFKERIEIDEQAFINFTQVQTYSVLTVKTDPGLPLTATGGILLILGISAVVLMPRKKPARIQTDEEGTNL